MPKTINEVVDKLEAAGVPMATPPADFVANIDAINKSIKQLGKLAISPEVMRISRHLLKTMSYEI